MPWGRGRAVWCLVAAVTLSPAACGAKGSARQGQDAERASGSSPSIGATGERDRSGGHGALDSEAIRAEDIGAGSTTTSRVSKPDVDAGGSSILPVGFRLGPGGEVYAEEVPEGRPALVTRVVDGDTIEVEPGERVRLIGVDTPESVDPRRPVECFGKEAAAFTSTLLPRGTRIVLESDVEHTDRYGRTLAYVYRGSDRLFVNATLLAAGYAQILTIAPNVAYTDLFLPLSRKAREEGRGLWSQCVEDVDGPDTEGGSSASAAGAPSPGAADSGAQVASPGCSPAYPDVCIPPPPPDLDCADIPYRRFRVLDPDPHGFDRGGDGVGCES